MATPTQIRSRGRLSLVIGTVLAALTVGVLFAYADTVTPDADVVSAGDQDNVNLGSFAPGATITREVAFKLECSQQKHVDQNERVTIDFKASGSTAPTGGSVGATNTTIGPIPAAWPDDGANCPSPAPTPLVASPNSTVTLTAPAAAGTYSYSVQYQIGVSTPTGQNTGADNSSDVTGSGTKSITYTVTVAAPAKQNQTITFDPLPNKTYGDADFTVSATASSGLAVSFAVGSGDQCTISGSTVHISGAGSCAVTASQGGSATYNAASPVSRTFSIAKANQTVNLGGVPFSAAYGDGFTPVVTASSGLTPSIGVSGVCTIGALGTVQMTSGSGACTVTASQAGNANYNAAASVSATATATKAAQTITFGALADKTYGDANFGVVASASSGLSVSFAASGDCTISGATVHLTGAGSCTITAAQGGNANYAAASDVSRAFAIAKASQTISFAPLGDKAYGDTDFAVTATGGGSGNPVTFTASGDCTVSAGTVHITGAGSCTITAAQTGNSNYEAAEPVARSFAIGKAHATLAFASGTLSRTYDGSAKPVSVNAIPAGLSGVSISYEGSSTAPSGAGSYPIHVTLTNANYAADPLDGTLVIAKASATLSLGDLTKTYDGSPQGTTVTTTPAGLSGASITYDGSAAAPTNAGSYAVVASLDNPNYAASNATGTLVISKASSTVTVSCSDGPFVYSGTAVTPCTAKATGIGGLDEGLTVSYSDNTNAGTAIASASFGGDANHTGDSGSKTFAISKAASTVTVTCGDGPFTYTGSAFTPCSAKALGAGGLDESLTVSYADNTNAGTATASASFGGDGNHTGDSGSATFAIAKAPSKVTLTCAAGPFTYTGSAFTPCSAKATGAAGLDATLAVAYSNNVGAGTATASASYGGDANHLGDSGSDTFTIGKASSTVTISCGDGPFVYMGSPQAPCSAKATGAGGLDKDLTVSYSDNTNAGTATASAGYGGDANHTGDAGSATFVIAKAPSTVAVSCGDGPFVFTGSAFTPCSAKATGVGALDVSVPVTYENNTNAGTATASATYAGDANHTGDSSSKTFAIAKAASKVTVTCPDSRTYTGSAIEPCSAKATGAGGLDEDLSVSYSDNTNAGTATASAGYGGDANHTGDAGSATFVIAKAPSTVAVSCGDGPFVFTGSAFTPCSAKATGVGALDVSVPVTYENNTNAGTATASAAYGGDANHTGDNSSATFAIAKAASKVTVSCPDSRTYTGSAIEPCSAKATGAGSLNVDLGVSYANNTDAGTASASATFDGDANHTGDSGGATFVIAKAPSTVVVTCDEGPFTYTGSAHTPCSAKATGAGGLNVTLDVSYTNNVNAGAATAAASYGGDANHLGDSSSKTFAIAKAPSTVSVSCEAGPFVYSGSQHTPCSARATGAGGLDVPLTVSYSDNVNAGTATASAGFVGDANHTGDSNSKTFAIAKAASKVTVTCPDSRTYTGSAIEPCSAKATGAGSLNATVPVSYSDNVNVGTAHASATYTGDANHNSDTGSGAFAIAKAPSTVTVTCPAGPFTYDGSAQTACSAKATGAGGLNATLTVSYTNNVNAGTATAAASYGGDANHLEDSSSQTFTIGKAPSTVTVTWVSWTYDGTPHPAIGSVTGVGGAALGTPSFTYYSGAAASGTPLAGAPANVGTYTVSASFAGNGNYLTGSKTKTVTVSYRWDGFLQPINDTAHQGGFESFFKLGSTIPAKFQLKKADGSVVQAAAAPTFSRSTTPIACDTQISQEAVDLDSGFGGSTFRWDATAMQYIYNWSTKGLKAGEYRIYATLDDGSKQFVDICLQ